MPSPVPTSSPLFSLTSLKYLDIFGPISSSQHASSLSECLPNLTEISLDDENSSVSILCLLNSLPAPSQLASLSVRSYGVPSNSELPAIPISFAPFNGLQSLKITCPVNLEGSEFYEDLRQLPLRQLKLGYGTKLSASGLKSLLDGSFSQLPLESLTLDNLHAYLRYNAGSRNYASYRPGKDDEDKASIALRLQGLNWTEHLSKQGLSELSKAGEEMGVSIQGRTLDALRLQEKFESGEVERERVIARTERAKEKARRDLIDGHA